MKELQNLHFITLSYRFSSLVQLFMTNVSHNGNHHCFFFNVRNRKKCKKIKLIDHTWNKILGKELQVVYVFFEIDNCSSYLL